MIGARPRVAGCAPCARWPGNSRSMEQCETTTTTMATATNACFLCREVAYNHRSLKEVSDISCERLVQAMPYNITYILLLLTCIPDGFVLHVYY